VQANNKRQDRKPRTPRILSCEYVIPKNLLLDLFEDGSIQEPHPSIYPAKKCAGISAIACILVGNNAHLLQSVVIIPISLPYEKMQH
jgi:hypothetical protein